MIKAGDIVKHKGSFLRSISWYTNVPKDGLVKAVDGSTLEVDWSDGDHNRILTVHVLPVHQPDNS